MKKESLAKDIIILTIITVVAGCLLGLIHNITEGPIEQQKLITLQNAQKEVFADADSFEDLKLDAAEAEKIAADAGLDKTTVNTVYSALDSQGSVLGYVVDVSNMEGYGGEIEVLVGVAVKDGECTINSISFLSLSETAGMGMKAKEPEFKDQFNSLSAQSVSLEDDGSSTKIDKISGATITSKSVAKDINAALAAAQYMEGK
ncbi:MAG: FMN-binding protein [Lachnospiraceae bacterium]|jgi:electron transport complex protein RnfG